MRRALTYSVGFVCSLCLQKNDPFKDYSDFQDFQEIFII